MLGEFSFRGKTYCIKKIHDKDRCEGEIIKFTRQDELRSFFQAVFDDPDAWPIIMTIAQWNYPVICRPPENCPEPTDQDYFDKLCFQISSGDLILTEKKPGAEFNVSIKDLKLPRCCIGTIKKINERIMDGQRLSFVIIAAPVFQAFFSHPETNKWVSLASTVFSITTQDWRLFAKAGLNASLIARRDAFDLAELHAFDHEKNNDFELKLFWVGVMNVFE